MPLPEIRISGEREKRLKQRLSLMRKQAMEAKGNWDESHAEYWKMWRAMPRQRVRTFPWKGAYNLYPPLTRVVVEGHRARIHDSMFSGRPRVVPVEGLDMADAALLDAFYFEYVFKEIVNLIRLGSDWNFETLLCGTGAVSTRWVREERLRRIQIEVPEERIRRIRDEVAGVPVPVEPLREVTGIRMEERIRWDRTERPLAETVDLTKIFPAPGSGPSFQWPECPWYFEKMEVSVAQLRQWRRDGFKNIDDDLLKTARPTEATAIGHVHDEDEESGPDRTMRVPVERWFLRMALDVEYHRGEDVVRQKGDSFKQKKADPNPIDEEVVLYYFSKTDKIGWIQPLERIRPDGMRPHVANRFLTFPRRFWGMGLAAKMRQLQKWMNSLVNQRMDYGTISVIPWFMYSPASVGTMPDLMNLRPGKGVPVFDPSGVAFPRLQQNDAGFWMGSENTCQSWAERDSQMTDTLLGRNSSLPNAQRTARGMQAVLSQAEIGFGQRVAEMGLAYEELFRHFHELFRKNAPPEMEMRFFNRETGMYQNITVSNSVFDRDVDFRFELNPNRQAEQQNRLQLYQLLTQIPFVAQDPRKVRALAKKVYESSGEKDFEIIWPESDLQLDVQTPPAFNQGQPQQGLPAPQGLEQFSGFDRSQAQLEPAPEPENENMVLAG